MTELERKLTAALRKLSAQYETEQRRHTEQVEALQQRVSRSPDRCSLSAAACLYGVYSKPATLPVGTRMPPISRKPILTRACIGPFAIES